MEKLIKKKITILIPEYAEKEFELISKEFKDFVLIGAERAISNSSRSAELKLLSQKLIKKEGRI